MNSEQRKHRSHRAPQGHCGVSRCGHGGMRGGVRTVPYACLLFFRLGFQRQIIIAQFVHFKSVSLVGVIVEGFQFINGELMEFIKIVPPFVTRV